MAKKDNTLIWVLAGAAVLGYFVFKQNTSLNNPANVLPPGTHRDPVTGAIVQDAGNVPLPTYQVQDPHQIAIEQPAPDVIGIYAPNLDPTGRSITLY